MRRSEKFTAGEIVVITVVSVLAVASYWYVGPILWRWYAVPLGIPAVTWRGFAGFSVLVGLMAYRYRNQVEGFDGAVSRTVSSMIVPWMGLLFGWLLLP